MQLGCHRSGNDQVRKLSSKAEIFTRKDDFFCVDVVQCYGS